MFKCGLYYKSIKNLDIDKFSSDNKELLNTLKSHFYEYVMNNNNTKNSFAEKIKVGKQKNSIKDLSKDIDKEKLSETFDKVLNGEETEDQYNNPRNVSEYVMQTIGRYTKNDIQNNFDFILYDINKNDDTRIDERRKKYNEQGKLTNSQLQKVDEVNVLVTRLLEMDTKESKELLQKFNNIKENLKGNISKLEDIYSDYEALYRQNIVDNLYVPKDKITIIDNYKDIKPQLIHKFIRSQDKFKDLELEKLKNKIISERTNGNNSLELTAEEKVRFEKMSNSIGPNLDQYKVNYTTDGKGVVYTDSTGIDGYSADTTNQISASILNSNNYIYSQNVGILGIGFNKETLSPEAIAVSSNSYKTTNKGLNNLEYDENNEFQEMSAPFQELLKANRNSEVVMHRKGIDFDTKASYIYVQIDSSNEKQTQEIMEQAKNVSEEENLKLVVYDIYKIRESYEQDKKQEKEKQDNQR